MSARPGPPPREVAGAQGRRLGAFHPVPHVVAWPGPVDVLDVERELPDPGREVVVADARLLLLQIATELQEAVVGAGDEEVGGDDGSGGCCRRRGGIRRQGPL